MVIQPREELVGKRFLFVNGTGKLKLSKIEDWDWRAGIIRAVDNWTKGQSNPDLAVCYQNFTRALTFSPSLAPKTYTKTVFRGLATDTLAEYVGMYVYEVTFVGPVRTDSPHRKYLVYSGRRSRTSPSSKRGSPRND